MECTMATRVSALRDSRRKGNWPKRSRASIVSSSAFKHPVGMRRCSRDVKAFAIGGFQAALTDIGRALRGMETIDAVCASPSLEDVQSPSVNIGHLKRTLPKETLAALANMQSDAFSVKVDVHAGCSTELRGLLARHIPDERHLAFLIDDIMELHESFLAISGSCCASVRLDWVYSTMCPRLHVDNVPLRLLVTYTGAGTLYAENAAVDRTKLLVPPEALGNDGAIRPGHELKQTSVGDVLLLKGNTWPGNEGCGAIHRSPHDVSSKQPRLVLTIDCPS